MDTDGLHIKYMYFTMHKNMARHLFKRKTNLSHSIKGHIIIAKQTTIKTVKKKKTVGTYIIFNVNPLEQELFLLREIAFLSELSLR